jgi:NADPH:quinone reductase-like Zn-dependent oxidoreductase
MKGWQVIPEKMRAMVLTGHGGLDKLEYREDWPVPKVGERDVLIKVGACGINNMDLNARVGWYGATVTEGMSEKVALEGADEGASDLGNWNRSTFQFPRIQGSAIAGTIVAVGGKIDKDRVGQRVLIDSTIRDETLPEWARAISCIGSESDGGLAEYVAVPSENAFHVKRDVAFTDLAGLPVSHTTAEEMLVRVRLQEGEKIVVRGAGGGVGTALVQLASLRGAHVIAIASADKEDAIRALGAADFIAREERDQVTLISDRYGNRGIDVVADVVGGSDAMNVLRLLRRGGRYVTAGAIAGPLAQVDLRDIIYKDLQLMGIASPELQTTLNLLQYVEAGQISANVDRVFPLSALHDAQRAFAQKKYVGKIVIEVSPDTLADGPSARSISGSWPENEVTSAP